jgi:hypothetical protein
MPDSPDIIVPSENADHVQPLDGWIRERATLHLLESDEKWNSTPVSSVRFLAGSDALDHVRRVTVGNPATDALYGDPQRVDGIRFRFVSGSITETLWDISIDTSGLSWEGCTVGALQ